MSPTYFTAQMARLDKELETARKADDMTRTQRLLGEQTALVRAMYGQPQG